jgi:transposase InsO family protein
VIFHGAQYSSRAFAQACAQAGIRQSMGAVGSCADNALAEAWFATLKRELLHGRRWLSTEQVPRDVFA